MTTVALQPPPPTTVETGASWVAALSTLVILSFSYGAPYVTAVGLRPMADEFGTARSVPALAASLAWFFGGLGGIGMGWIADRVGVRWTVLVGGVMVGSGLVISTLGDMWSLWIGHGLLIGLLGNAGINVPLMTYVSRWFDRRRGTALALVASGQYVAGVIWPSIFQYGIGAYGWRWTMAAYGILVMLAVVPLAIIFLKAPPAPIPVVPGAASGGETSAAKPLSPAFFLFLCAAPFLCCVPMSMPQGHLVAFCGDLGISGARGAAMLSLMLACAFVARQFWGALSDRVGGLRTILAGSVCQMAALTAFLLTQDETGLFVVAAAFGLGFSGLIPAYVFTVRELYPSNQAGWRVPTVFFFGTGGMAFGGWAAGLIYDSYGTYAAAWGAGIAINAVHFVLVGSLLLYWLSRRRAAQAA